jgi:hypothetical protein
MGRWTGGIKPRNIDLPRWAAMLSFHPNISNSPERGNHDMVAREGRNPLTCIHKNRCSKLRNCHMPRSDAIVDFVVDPLERGVKKRTKRARTGSFITV